MNPTRRQLLAVALATAAFRFIPKGSGPRLVERWHGQTTVGANGAYKTLQAALDAAGGDGVIHLLPGHSETIAWPPWMPDGVRAIGYDR